MKAASILLVAAAILAMAAGPCPAAEPPNLVANGDFLQVVDGRPERWRAEGDANVAQTLAAAKDADGKPFARLVCTRCEGRSPASHAMLAQVGCVNLARGKLYEFSCRMRAQGLRGRAVSVALSETQGWTNCGLYADVAVGPAWRACKRVFHATRDVGPTGRLQIWFAEPGTLDVADVRIIECAAAEVEFTDVVPAAGGKNLVRNGSFEVGPGGWSSLGTRTGWGNMSHLHGKIAKSDAGHGRAFLRIPLGGDQTPVLYFDYYEPVVRKELRPLAASLGWIPVARGAAYALSCDLRASRAETRALLGARSKDPAGGWRDHLQAVKLGTTWKRYTFTFKPDHRYVFVMAGPDLAADDRVDVDLDAVQLEKGEEATPFEPRSEVEFALEPSEAAGLFVAGRPAALRWTACNHGASAARASLALEVTDFKDKAVPWRGEQTEIPAGQVAERTLDVPAAWKGFYRVRATMKAGGSIASADLPLAIVPPRTAEDSVCGINHAFTSADLLRLASKAGVTWYRDWSLKWQHIEPARGEFHWQVGDAQIDRVLREGPRVLALLPPFPSADWSSEAPAGLPDKGYPGVRLRQAWAPKDPKDLAAFVGAAVARYKDRIHVWEFLNEPIYTDYALPGEGKTRYGAKYKPADYVALLETAARAMRASDPTCRVIGGIAGGTSTFTREVIEAGCLKHLDLFNLHFYPGSRRPEGYAPEMDGLLALMDAHGGRKPLWITEFSYYGADRLPRKPFFPGTGDWSEERLLESERECADLTLRFFAVMLARGVEKIFIHSGASGQVNEPAFECALMDYGGAPRKLLPALAVFTDLLGGEPRAAGDRRLGESGYAVAFETGRRSVLVLWKDDADAAARVEAPTSADLGRLDIMGRDLPPGTLGLATSPMYLVGPPGKAKEILASLRPASAP